MKACNACHIHVQMDDRHFCPLCGTELQNESDVAYPLAINTYPNMSGELRQYNFVKRLLLFLTLLSCGVSLLVNWLVTPDFWWCLIVLATAAYCWFTIPPLLRRGTNYATRVVWQVFFTSVLLLVLDFIFGYQGWSVSYVIPNLLSAGILAIGLMAIFNRTNWAQYMFAQVWMAIFAFAPLILYLMGIAHNLIIVLITTTLGLASILVMFVFGDRTLKTEFKRRFHF